MLFQEYYKKNKLNSRYHDPIYGITPVQESTTNWLILFQKLTVLDLDIKLSGFNFA